MINHHLELLKMSSAAAVTWVWFFFLLANGQQEILSSKSLV